MYAKMSWFFFVQRVKVSILKSVPHCLSSTPFFIGRKGRRTESEKPDRKIKTTHSLVNYLSWHHRESFSLSTVCTLVPSSFSSASLPGGVCGGPRFTFVFLHRCFTQRDISLTTALLCATWKIQYSAHQNVPRAIVNCSRALSSRTCVYHALSNTSI